MIITPDTLISEIVTKNYKASEIFKKYEIDFCCNWNRPLNEVCKAKNLDTNEIINKLTSSMSNDSWNTIDFTSWPVDLLIDYIVKKHHRYIREKTPEIINYLEKISRVHGENHQELIEVEKEFKASIKSLNPHLEEEENIIFPQINNLFNNPSSVDKVAFKKLIAIKMQEHDVEWERFRTISKLTNNYTVPKDWCNTYRVSLALLKEFENDLHLHIHIESNILFPKALEIIK